ncbi:MAG: FAD-dependent oxidoreductase [Candidatus Saccharibacteria bacterium]|jgi:alkyl hydroperoxide reductase subunit F
MESTVTPDIDTKPVAGAQVGATPAAETVPPNARHDVIIIGGGPAGMTAAIYCARKKLKVLLLTKDLGGQAAWSSDVENYLGFSMISGTDLVKHFQDHMQEFADDITLKLMNDGVKSVAAEPGGFAVKLADGSVDHGRAVIIASGKVPKKLGIDGETEFLNRGVTYCAWCDGPLFKGKTVAIIGGGNSALDAALSVQKLAKQIYIVNNADELTGDEVMIEKVMAAHNVRVLNHAQALTITGDKLLRGLTIRDAETGLDKELAVEGVFVEIGSIPSSDYLKDVVNLNQHGEVIIDKRNMTSQPGIFAAGDVTEVIEKQIIIAAGEGSKAAIQTAQWLSRQP